MKTNKKAILGFAMSMIFSLAIMQGISQKNVQQQRSLQQVSLGSAYAAGQAESQSWQNVWNQTTEISNIVLEWEYPLLWERLLLQKLLFQKQELQQLGLLLVLPPYS